MAMLRSLLSFESIREAAPVEVYDVGVRAPKHGSFWAGMIVMHHPETADKDLQGQRLIRRLNGSGKHFANTHICT